MLEFKYLNIFFISDFLIDFEEFKPYFIPKFKLDKIGFDNTKVIIDDIRTFISDNKITIKDESDGIVYDNHHAGYLGTDYITKTIFNKLSDFNFIDSNGINLPNIQKLI